MSTTDDTNAACRGSGSNDLLGQASERDGDGTLYRWLVEEFSANGSSTGRYMLDQSTLTITANVHEARQFLRMRTAMLRAADMREKHGGDWRHAHHGFVAANKTPNAQFGLDPRRGAFEFFFAYSRRGRGPSKVPTFERLGDGTYADDHTQRHWWTWQRAQAEEREQMGRPTQEMELAGMRALRNTHRTVSGEYSREQASACWHAMVAALKA